MANIGRDIYKFFSSHSGTKPNWSMAMAPICPVASPRFSIISKWLSASALTKRTSLPLSLSLELRTLPTADCHDEFCVNPVDMALGAERHHDFLCECDVLIPRR